MISVFQPPRKVSGSDMDGDKEGELTSIVFHYSHPGAEHDQACDGIVRAGDLPLAEPVQIRLQRRRFSCTAEGWQTARGWSGTASSLQSATPRSTRTTALLRQPSSRDALSPLSCGAQAMPTAGSNDVAVAHNVCGKGMIRSWAHRNSKWR